MSIPFLKMHGLGNDFIVIDDLEKPKALCHKITAATARAMCDRRWGIGADQVLWLKSPEQSHTPEGALHDARMEILNADGSTAEMCGNGIRAVALYLYRHGPQRKPHFWVETLAGTKGVEVHEGQVSVEMGAPGLGAGFVAGFAGGFEGEAIQLKGRELRFHEVSMGNPHAVVFVEAGDHFPVEEFGPLLENHPRFPRRTNVEFVEVTGPSAIRVRVWERGAGITLACGTGACASAVAALATARVQGAVQVALPGGELLIRWAPGQSVMMVGPAEEVFRGEYFESAAS